MAGGACLGPGSASRAPGRRRGGGLFQIEAANAIGNQHHAAFQRAEQRRVDELNRKAREEAQRAGQARLDAAAAELEAQALAAEEASADLIDRERRFVELVTAWPPHALSIPGVAPRCLRVLVKPVRYEDVCALLRTLADEPCGPRGR